MDLSALTLSSVLALSPAPASRAPASSPVPVVLARSGARVTWTAAVAALSRASVVAVGETHDDPEHHRVQAEAVRALAAARPVTVAFEMVSVDDQAVLDAFASGAMSEAAFAAWWKGAWGFDYALYKPVFDAARAAGAPLAALNLPRGVAREIARKGLSGLPPIQRSRLPASIRESDDPRYRVYVEASLDQHGPMPADRRARMREAQAAWNEAMGENAARLAASGRLVVVIAGGGHMVYGGGIPESAARRGARALVLLPHRGPSAPDLALADFHRLLP